MPEPTRPNVFEIDPDGPLATSPVHAHAIVDDAWESHRGELFNFLRYSTRDEAAAEDLLQETFLRLTTEVSAGRVPLQLRAWLYRVASNLVTSRGRRRTTVLRWMRQHAGAEARHDPVESPETTLLRRERTSDLDAVLGALPADARMALLLSGEGFTGLEIATAIGRSHAATRTLLSRTRVQLRLELERREAAE